MTGRGKGNVEAVDIIACFGFLALFNPRYQNREKQAGAELCQAQLELATC